MSLYFDNNLLFDQDGHLTDEGLEALKQGTLDDLGSLEAAEHLTFCDYCLLRYTALVEAMPQGLQAPMRDLIPQVQNLMRLRSFRIMTNRYVSTAAAVVLAFALWKFGLFTAPAAAAPAEKNAGPAFSISQTLGGLHEAIYGGFNSWVASAQTSLGQLNDSVLFGGEPAKGE